MSCADRLHRKGVALLKFKANTMKYYNLESILTFGKFDGLTISQVLINQPTYVNWCIENLDHFYIMEEDQLIIKSIFNGFVINEDKMSFELDDYDTNSNYEADSYDDFTDWSHYDDGLDMDQQSIEFWNQF